MERYILMPYEESEEFKDVDGCYFIFDPFYTGQDVPIIVPEKEYCKKKVPLSIFKYMYKEN